MAPRPARSYDLRTCASVSIRVRYYFYFLLLLFVLCLVRKSDVYSTRRIHKRTHGRRTNTQNFNAEHGKMNVFHLFFFTLPSYRHTFAIIEIRIAITCTRIYDFFFCSSPSRQSNVRTLFTNLVICKLQLINAHQKKYSYSIAKKIFSKYFCTETDVYIITR